MKYIYTERNFNFTDDIKAYVEKKLAKLTTIVAIVFVVAVIVAFVFQNRFEQTVDPNAGYSQVEDDHEGHDHGTTAPETDAPETDAPEAQGTEAAE